MPFPGTEDWLRCPTETGFDASAEFLTFLWWKSGSGIRQA